MIALEQIVVGARIMFRSQHRGTITKVNSVVEIKWDNWDTMDYWYLSTLLTGSFTIEDSDQYRRHQHAMKYL